MEGYSGDLEGVADEHEAEGQRYPDPVRTGQACPDSGQRKAPRKTVQKREPVSHHRQRHRTVDKVFERRLICLPVGPDERHQNIRSHTEQLQKEHDKAEVEATRSQHPAQRRKEKRDRGVPFLAGAAKMRADSEK